MSLLRAVSVTLTIDEIAALPDAELIRRRFDAANVRWAAAFSIVALAAAIIQTLVSLGHGAQTHVIWLTVINVMVSVVAAAFFVQLARAQHPGTDVGLPVHLLARNLTPWIVGFVIVEFTLFSYARNRGSDAWMGWAMMTPWLLIPLRLDASRRLAMHISLVVVSLLNLFLLGAEGKTNAPEFVAVTMMNVFAFLVGALTSRRLRKQTLSDWSQRREHAREQVRMRDELQYAREVQLNMLPDAPPGADWLDVAASSVPATEVGGDYYDYFVDRDAISIVCGDVAGHGLASGIVLASLRAGFTLLHESLPDPAAMLQRLSDLVARASRRRMLATAAVVRIDRSTRRAMIASAGHPPVIVRRNGTVESIELFAPPLGVRLPHQVPSRELTFDSGDIFVLHSDGVYESLSAAGESFGLERLEQIVAASEGASAAAIRDTVLSDLEKFRGGAPVGDDVTIVVARVR